MIRSHENLSDFIPAGKAANILGVSRATILRWGNQGKLRRKKIGLKCYRYNPSDLFGMVEEA